MDIYNISNKKRALLSLILSLVLILLIQGVQAQTCSHPSRDSWTWPGHNNWFIPLWSPSDGKGYIIDQRANTISAVGQANFTPQTLQTTSIRGYQGIAAASDDNGKLLFFTNGRKAWKADGTLISDKILQGNECGSVEDRGSAVHGCMIVRHPLQPNAYYIITIDDIVNQGNVGPGNQAGTCGNGVTFAVVDSSGNMVHDSEPIERDITSGNLGAFRTTEGFSATFHGNGVDIWITFHPLWSDNYVSYLLTCDGFVTPPVSSGEAPWVEVAYANGDVDFSPDGSMMAAGVEIYSTGGKNMTHYAHGTVNVYDFDNWTGQITNRKAVYPNQWSSQNIYNLKFAANGTDLYWSGTSAAGKLDVSVNTQTAMRASATMGNTAFLSNSFHGAALNYQGVIEQRNVTNSRFPQIANSHYGANDMYIPPLEEPDIEEVGPFCDTTQIIDLETNWLCSGLDAEDLIDNRHSYSGAGIVDDKLGHFNPAIAGEGFHDIIFTFCGVDDTITIEVLKCAVCEVDLQEITPKFCIGNDYLLDTLVVLKSKDGIGTWDIDSFPTNPFNDAVLNDSGSDTLFDATDLATRWGTYKMIYTVDNDGEVCYDSIYITVDSLPNPVLTGDTICDGDGAVTFDPGTFDSYLWGPDGETTPTITKDASATITVEVTDGEGCQWSDTVEFLVNPLPIPFIENDTICVGQPLVTFDAGNYVDFNWSSGETTQTITPVATGDYTVEVTDTNGCKEDTTLNFTIHPKPVVDLGVDQVICFEDPAVTFDALNPGINYTWSNGETTQSIDTDVDGEYTIIIEDANNCSDTDTVVLTVNPLPIVDLGGPQEICQVDPEITLDAGNVSADYLWSGGETAQTINTKVEAEYSVIVTDTNGCIGRDTMYLTVNPMPTVNMADQVICFGDAAVTFDVAASFQTYLWSSGEGTQTISTDQDGEYIVTFTDNSGCSGNDTVVLTVNPLPTPDLGVNQTICADAAAVVFDASSEYTDYAWGSGETTQTLSTTTAGTHTVEVTDTNGCKESASVDLIVIDLPTPDVILDATMCPGMSSTLDASVYDNGNGPFTYVWHDGSTGSSFSTNAAANAWVDISDSYGCTGRDLADVSINADLTVAIVGAPLIELCEGENTDLVPNYKAADGYFFSWSNGASTETINVDATGTFDLHVDNGLGCEGNATIDVRVHPLPSLTPTTAGICDGEAATIGTSLGTSYTYLWNTGETSAQISVLTAGTYNQEVTSNQGCVSQTTVTVDVFSNPVPSLGNDINVCEGVPVTLSEQSGLSNITYTWSSGSTDPTISPTSSGTYSLTVTTAENCVGSDDVEVNFIGIPTVDLGNDITLCEGEFTTVDAGNDNLSVTWNTGQSSSEITVNATNQHIVIVDNGTCTATDTIDITVVSLPESNIDHTLADQAYCFDELIGRGLTIEAGPNPSYDYLWGTGETTSEINVEAAGTFIVSITVGNCEITDQITFYDYCPSTLYVPNTFTPNDDGVNDVFTAQGSYITDYTMLVYDRWGLLLYESEDMNMGWDGTYMNNPVQIDTYVYKIYYSINQADGNLKAEQKVGHVNVIR